MKSQGNECILGADSHAKVCVGKGLSSVWSLDPAGLSLYAGSVPDQHCGLRLRNQWLDSISSHQKFEGVLIF